MIVAVVATIFCATMYCQPRLKSVTQPDGQTVPLSAELIVDVVNEHIAESRSSFATTSALCSMN